MKLLASRGAALARARSHTPGTLIPGFVSLMLKGLILTVSLILAQAEKGEAQTTEYAAVTTPAGATHGALVNGNLPRASSANQLTDSGIAASSVATATNTQTLQNKSISGAQNTLTNIPAGALAGTVPSANGGAGAVTGALKGNGAGVVSQAGPGDIAAANATQGDVNISISSATRTLSVCATLTAARTATLPPANSLPAGQSVRIVDCGGSFSAGGSDTILPAGSDTENGATASGCTGSILCQVMAVQGAVAEATTDGVSNWNVTLSLPQAEPALPIADSVISLPNLVGKTTATVCMAADSTGTAGPVQGTLSGNAIDATQMAWSFLTEKLKHDLPGISWTFSNFAIGATSENNFLSTGNALGGSGNSNIPSWFTDFNQTWAYYVQNANCDVLFWMFGTNNASSGSNAGQSAATFIRQDFETINGWANVPKIVIVATKPANPANDTSGDDFNQSFHKAQAAFHRTFARSNAGGYTSFPNVTARGYGFVDLSRPFVARNDGHDPVAQYLQAKPSCLVNGFALAATSTVGSGSNTICTTKHGDYRTTFVLPAEGGVALWNYCHCDLVLSGGEFAGNYVRFHIGSNGSITPWYLLDGNIAGAPTVVGTNVTTTLGQDVMITVSASQERIIVVINGTTALDVDGPRFVSEAAGGTPINLGFTLTPTGSPVANITEFYEGIGYPTQAFSSYAWAMGNPGTCGSPTPNCQGGNANNHQRSNSAELDRQVIDALHFAVPAAASSSQFGQVKVDGTTITSAGGVISAPTSGQSVFDNTHQGVAPASGGGTTNYQRADGTWAPPPGTTCGGSACGTFATQNYATPPAIGGTTPAPGTFTTLTSNGHVLSSGSALSCGSNVTFGAGAGTSPTCTSITGDDHRFNVVFTAGTSTTTGVDLTVTFANAYTMAPQCFLGAAGGNAAAKMSVVYPTSTTTTVVLNSVTSALGASTVYTFNFNCTG